MTEREGTLELEVQLYEHEAKAAGLSADLATWPDAVRAKVNQALARWRTFRPLPVLVFEQSEIAGGFARLTFRWFDRTMDAPAADGAAT